MRVVVVTGTDLTVVVVKAVQSGTSVQEPTDVETVSALAGCPRVVELVRLDLPLAPDTAARRLGAAIPGVRELAARVHEAAQACDLVLLEGTGGVAVRLDTTGGTILDLASDLASETWTSADGPAVGFVVVTRVSLGTLNHTELTVDAVRRAGHAVIGLVFGDVPDAPGLAEQANLTELPRVTGLPLLGAIPHGAGRLSPAEFRTECLQWFGRAAWLPQR
jgi:dethiobiotin synthetase